MITWPANVALVYNVAVLSHQFALRSGRERMLHCQELRYEVITAVLRGVLFPEAHSNGRGFEKKRKRTCTWLMELHHASATLLRSSSPKCYLHLTIGLLKVATYWPIIFLLIPHLFAFSCQIGNK